jgi:predicted O-methyltransferase YrrM
MFNRVLPWITDSSHEFINGYITNIKKSRSTYPLVLEFGSGASTIFFATRSKKLYSIEHAPEWSKTVQELIKLLPDSSHIEYILSPRPYSDRVKDLPKDEKFDIISIDGRDRVECLRACEEESLLAERGIYILDNTERISGYGKRYMEMLDILSEKYNLISFEQTGADSTGWVPNHRWVTTIASKKNVGYFTTSGRLL